MFWICARGPRLDESAGGETTEAFRSNTEAKVARAKQLLTQDQATSVPVKPSQGFQMPKHHCEEHSLTVAPVAFYWDSWPLAPWRPPPSHTPQDTTGRRTVSCACSRSSWHKTRGRRGMRLPGRFQGPGRPEAPRGVDVRSGRSGQLWSMIVYDRHVSGASSAGGATSAKAPERHEPAACSRASCFRNSSSERTGGLRRVLSFLSWSG